MGRAGSRGAGEGSCNGRARGFHHAFTKNAKRAKLTKLSWELEKGIKEVSGRCLHDTSDADSSWRQGWGDRATTFILLIPGTRATDIVVTHADHATSMNRSMNQRSPAYS